MKTRASCHVASHRAGARVMAAVKCSLSTQAPPAGEHALSLRLMPRGALVAELAGSLDSSFCFCGVCSVLPALPFGALLGTSLF